MADVINEPEGTSRRANAIKESVDLVVKIESLPASQRDVIRALVNTLLNSEK